MRIPQGTEMVYYLKYNQKLILPQFEPHQYIIILPKRVLKYSSWA